jgi:hypothetical protein
MHAIRINYNTVRYSMGLIVTVLIIIYLVFIVPFHPFNHRPSKLGLLLRYYIHLIRTSACLLSKNNVFYLDKILFMIAIKVVEGLITELVYVSEDILKHAYVSFLNRGGGILR